MSNRWNQLARLTHRHQSTVNSAKNDSPNHVDRIDWLGPLSLTLSGLSVLLLIWGKELPGSIDSAHAAVYLLIILFLPQLLGVVGVASGMIAMLRKRAGRYRDLGALGIALGPIGIFGPFFQYGFQYVWVLGSLISDLF